MDVVLWPCRGVAEHAYCPRLFYYMMVEGVFLPSADTEQGAGVHRRVDRPSAAPPEPEKATAKPGSTKKNKAVEKLEEGEIDPDRPRAVRSLALTSERLGLTATLDLAEIEGNRAVPVEYRKGKPRRTGRAQIAEPVDEMMDEPWQYSVFYCTLKAIDRVRLENAAREVHNLKEDQLLIVDLGSNEEAARESSTFLGVGVPEQETGMVVI